MAHLNDVSFSLPSCLPQAEEILKGQPTPEPDGNHKQRGWSAGERKTAPDFSFKGAWVVDCGEYVSGCFSLR